MFKFTLPGTNIWQGVLTCSGSDNDVKRGLCLLTDLNVTAVSEITMKRNLDGDQKPLETAREAINLCRIVIALLTEPFINDNLCLYEVALALDFKREIILLKYNDIRIPPMFEHLCIIDGVDSSHCLDLTKKRFAEVIKGETEECQGIEFPSTGDLVKQYLWYVQNLVYNKLKSENAEVQRRLIEDKQVYEQRIMKLYDQKAEYQNLAGQKETSIKSLQRELDVTRGELDKMQGGYSNSSRATETMDVRLSNIEGAVRALCDGLHTLQDNSALQSKIPERKSPLPAEIKRLAKKYHNFIGAGSIRHFGRVLDLEDADLDCVESFSEHGSAEMFWQTIRIWVATANKDVINVSMLVKALKEAGVDLEGRELSREHQGILFRSIGYLSEHLCDIQTLMPYLVSNDIVCPTTRSYIIAPKTRDQQILRLVDVLKMKENGLKMFQKALVQSGNSFISDHIDGLIPQSEENVIQPCNKPIAVLRPSPKYNPSSSSETDLKEILSNYQSHSRSLRSSRSSSISSHSSASSTAVIQPMVQNVTHMTSNTLPSNDGNNGVKSRRSQSKTNRRDTKMKPSLTKDTKGSDKQRPRRDVSLNCVKSCVLQ